MIYRCLMAGIKKMPNTLFGGASVNSARGYIYIIVYFVYVVKRFLISCITKLKKFKKEKSSLCIVLKNVYYFYVFVKCEL